MTAILSLAIIIVFGFFALQQQPCKVAATRGPTQVMVNKDISVQSETRDA